LGLIDPEILVQKAYIARHFEEVNFNESAIAMERSK
jgi:hypothetical protein